MHDGAEHILSLVQVGSGFWGLWTLPLHVGVGRWVVGGGGPLGGPQASGGGLRAGARGLGARGGARLEDKEVQNLRAARALRRASASERGDFFLAVCTSGPASGHFRVGLWSLQGRRASTQAAEASQPIRWT